MLHNHEVGSSTLPLATKTTKRVVFAFKKSFEMNFFTYILYCELRNRYYTGFTENIERRVVNTYLHIA